MPLTRARSQKHRLLLFQVSQELPPGSTNFSPAWCMHRSKLSVITPDNLGLFLEPPAVGFATAASMCSAAGNTTSADHAQEGDIADRKGSLSSPIMPARLHAALPQDDEEVAIGLPQGSADGGSSSSLSYTSAGGRARSPPARTRAKLIIDGAYLEASIKVAAEGRKGRLDHQLLLTSVEERLDAMADKKILFQATPDGQPNSFHRQISHPDGAHVKVVLQPLKARLVTVEVGGIKQNQELLLDKGMDLALALEILEPFEVPCQYPTSPPSAPATGGCASPRASQASNAGLLIVITGDGDLQPVMERAERAGHRVVVMGGRKTLSERLHHYVRKGNGTAIWLDDLIEQAWVSPRINTNAPPSSTLPSASSLSIPSPVGSRTPVNYAGTAVSTPTRPPSQASAFDPNLLSDPALLASALKFQIPNNLNIPPYPSSLSSPPSPYTGMPPLPSLHAKQKLYRCPQGRFCDKLDEAGHLRALRHPCPRGATCPYALGRVPSDIDRRDHMLSFVHICPKGTSCPRNDIEHCTHFDHPYRRTKARCPDGIHCPHLTRGAAGSNAAAREHSRTYRHPCPKGSTCPLLAGKQPSEKKRYHLMDYTHPCHVGCKYSVDKEWAWQHFSDFDHVEDGLGLDTRSNVSEDGSIDPAMLLSAHAGGGGGGHWHYGGNGIMGGQDDLNMSLSGNGGQHLPMSSLAGSMHVPAGSLLETPTSTTTAGSGFLPSPTSTLESSGSTHSLGGSLFASDFYKPFPPHGLKDMSNLSSALQSAAETSSIQHGNFDATQPWNLRGPSGAGVAASPMRDSLSYPSHQDGMNHHGQHVPQQHTHHVPYPHRSDLNPSSWHSSH